MRAMALKVPHVHGKSLALMDELMEARDGEAVCGCEKLWTARNLPGLPGLGMMEIGDVWKDPMRASTLRLGIVVGFKNPWVLLWVSLGYGYG